MFHLIHFLFKILPASFQYMFYLRDRDDREEFREQEIAGEEQPECSHVKSNLPNGWGIINTMGRWQVIAVYGGNNDHKSFEPHTNVHQHTHKESHQ